MLLEIVESSDKKRFTLSDDKKKIRAAQGHSVNIDLNLTPSIPPSTLYHGTAQNNINSIMNEGIKPRNRDKVHLSKDIETALKVGQRHGKPVVFKVNANAMSQDEIIFWQADNGVWLIDYVAPKYLSLLER